MSCIHFDLHPGVEEIFMGMRLTVLAHHTLALLRALHSCAVTVAVVLAALRFLTSAPALGYKGRNPLEGAWVSEVGQLLGLVYLKFAVLPVAAIVALTFFIANSSLRKALAVHFQAVNFSALTALVGGLAGREVHGGNGAKNIFVLGFAALFYQLVEEILLEGHHALVPFDFLFRDEFEGSRRRRRAP